VSGRWADSTRRHALPADWPQRRDTARRRAGGRCEGRIRGTRCPNHGAECDHIKSHAEGGTDDLSNLQWLCTSCHKAKTAGEAARARRAIRARRFRPPDPHPGLKEPT
jgi:5-methylcytosine-specific restriction protein A